MSEGEVTHDLRAWERLLDAWVAQGELSAGPEPFEARIRRRRVMGMEYLDVAAGRERIVHRARHVAGTRPFCMLSLQIEGRCAVSQGGRRAVLAAGDFTLRNMGRPSEVEAQTAFRQLLFRIPMDRLGAAALLDRVAAMRMPGDDGPTGAVSAFLRALCLEPAPALEAAPLGFAATMQEMVGLAMRTTALGLGEPRGNARLLARIEDLVERRLGAPDLGTPMVAAEMRVSPRYVQRLFAATGRSLTDYVRERRLERCRMQIEDPGLQSRSITEICHHWGFSDISHFSRVYRARFGVPPSVHRRAAIEASCRETPPCRGTPAPV